MIQNTYDAITTSEKGNIKIDKSQKKEFTGIERGEKNILVFGTICCKVLLKQKTSACKTSEII